MGVVATFWGLGEWLLPVQGGDGSSGGYNYVWGFGGVWLFPHGRRGWFLGGCSCV